MSKKITVPKRLTKTTVADLLKKAVKELADGHPTELAAMIEYDYSNMAAVYAERKQPKKLPLVPTDKLCKLIGYHDPIGLYRSQYLE